MYIHSLTPSPYICLNQPSRIPLQKSTSQNSSSSSISLPSLYYFLTVGSSMSIEDCSSIKLWQAMHPHFLVHLRPCAKHQQYFFWQRLFWHEHPRNRVMLFRDYSRVVECSWFSQNRHWHITEQYCPFDRHSQYSFRHLVFLHEHMLECLSGSWDFKFRQLGQHSGVQGKGDRKQLQLQARHSSATKQTQLWILGGSLISISRGLLLLPPSEPSETMEFSLEDPIRERWFM